MVCCGETKPENLMSLLAGEEGYIIEASATVVLYCSVNAKSCRLISYNRVNS